MSNILNPYQQPIGEPVTGWTARAKPPRNVIEGRIRALETRGTLVRAHVDCGVEFIAHLTPGAARTLELAEGSRVWLVLKTHSCHLVDE